MKISLTLCLFLSFSQAWAFQVESLDTVSDEELVLEQSLETEESSSQKFSTLVKSTMELMGPPEETSEVATNPEVTTTQTP